MLRQRLDTNLCIYMIKRRRQKMLERFHQHAGHLAISAITLSKLLHGMENSAAHTSGGLSGCPANSPPARGAQSTHSSWPAFSSSCRQMKEVRWC
jgi:hypothetical protein